MEFNEPTQTHNHDLDKNGEKVNCPICKELVQKDTKENDMIFHSPKTHLQRTELMVTPHKLVNGIVTVCQNPDCKICRRASGPSSDITYYMDLPGPCPLCGDNSCCEGVEKLRIFTIK